MVNNSEMQGRCVMLLTDVVGVTLGVVDDASMYPQVQVIDQVISDGGELVVLDGYGECLSFASNNYLGIAGHPKVIEAAHAALDRYGLGSGGSRLTVGTTRAHAALEERLASFKGTEDAVVFSAGYLANLGTLQALTTTPLHSLVRRLDPERAKGFTGQSLDVFVDALSHRSILEALQGRQVGSAEGMSVHVAPYLNVKQLEGLLRKSQATAKLIVTDGVFSLHGRLAPLSRIRELATQHSAQIYVDDAHGVGVLGPRGRGTAEHLGVTGVDYCMGTLSKALGAQGGYVAGTREFCRYLRIAAPSYMFQTALPPSVVAGALAAVKLIDEEPWRRTALCANAEWFREELLREGFEILGSTTHIVPVQFYTEAAAQQAFRTLLEHGFFAPAYYYPAVRKNEAMLRMNLTSSHQRADL